jgi:hypothetical protein
MGLSLLPDAIGERWPSRLVATTLLYDGMLLSLTTSKNRLVLVPLLPVT